MANQFEVAGSQNPEKPHKVVPLATTKIFTGYWPNSAPYRDAAVPFLYEKFYGASRNDKIADGHNVEVSPQMTLIRRPGTTIWNSNTFFNVTGFYSFRPFEAGVGEQTLVMVDTTADSANSITGFVYIAGINGTPVQDIIYTKPGGINSTSGPSRFQAEGNTLYWGDGVNTLKYSWFPAWKASTLLDPGTCIIDPNGNIQQWLGYGQLVTATFVTSNTMGFSTFSAGVGFSINVGDVLNFIGLTTKTGLNGINATVTSVSVGGLAPTISYVTPNYSIVADTGAMIDITKGAATTDASMPTFSTTIGTVTLDGFGIWICRGSAVQNMGIVAPTLAPTVQVIPVPAFNTWAASTYYWPNPCIIDSNTGTGPWVWQLTTPGTTNSSVPSGLTTGTPTPEFSAGTTSTPTTVTDGSAVWSCNSKAGRITNTAYSQSQIIAVSWTYIYYTYTQTTTTTFVGGGSQQFFIPTTTLVSTPHEVTYSAFFECVTPGTSSTTATSGIAWQAGLNSQITDGTVTWQNIGLEVTRLAATTVAPTGGGNTNIVSGNVGNTVLVSNLTEIQDSNGNGEIPTIAGPSASAHPTWPTALGATVTETSGLTWSNQGQFGAANTGSWYYTYTYLNAATGDESSAAPLSQAILLPANSGALLSGPGSPDTQVTNINIYRTTQQAGTAQGTPFYLRTILAPPSGGQWSTLDNTSDPPVPGSTLDIEITAPGFGVVNGIVTNFNDPPPTGLTNLSFHAGRMFGTVGNITYYSTGPDVTTGNGNTSWSVLNFFETPGTQSRLWPTTVGMFVFSNDGLWIIQGLGTSTNPFQQIQLVDPDISIVGYNDFTTAGTQANIFTSDRLYLSLDPQNGTSWLGQPVATVLANPNNDPPYTPGEVYLTYHSNGLDQKGFIISDNGWLNWMSVPAPETGFLWNPPAAIASPVNGAMASVEVTPGVFQLLLGPGAIPGGQILMRDSTFSVFTDGGTSPSGGGGAPYPAWVVFGNIVFAHHGQMAGLVHVGADFVRLGAEPIASCLLDEILNQPGTPEWVIIPNPVNDPPNLPASATIFQLRYWMIETQEPIYCRNGLFKFDFSEDEVKNELLCFTIFGESMTEGGGT